MRCIVHGSLNCLKKINNCHRTLYRDSQ